MANLAEKGFNVGFGSIFFLGIGLGVANGVIATLVNLSTLGTLLLGFVDVIIIGMYLWNVYYDTKARN